MSQTRRLLIQMALLLVVAGGIGLYAWQGIYEKDRKAEAQKDVELRLFTPYKADEKQPDGGVPSAEFVYLKVSAPAGTTVLERTPGGPWRVTQPVQAKADSISADAIVSGLQQSKFKTALEAKPSEADLEKYGLKTPAFTVEAAALVGPQQERRSATLYGGLENSYDNSVYMRRNEDPTVFMAEGSIRYTFAKSTFELRDKEVLALDEAELTAMDVKAPNNTYSLRRADAGEWTITSPLQDLAEVATVQSMMNSFRGERAQSFPQDTPTQRTAFGLDAPLLSARFTGRDGGVVEVKVSRSSPDGGATYALRLDGELATLAEVPGNATLHLDRNPLDLRDKSVLRFVREDAARLVFHPASGPDVVVERQLADGGPEVWMVTAPKAGPARSLKVSTALYELLGLKALVQNEDAPKKPEKYGLTARSRFVSIQAADGRELARLHIGSDVPGKTNTWVQGTRNIVMEIETSKVTALPFAVDDLLEAPPAPPDAGAADGG